MQKMGAEIFFICDGSLNIFGKRKCYDPFLIGDQTCKAKNQIFNQL